MRVDPGSADLYVVLGGRGSVVLARSRTPVVSERGDVTRVVLTGDVLAGPCMSSPLAKVDYDFIRERIFPAEDAPALEDVRCDLAEAAAADAGGRQ